MKSIDPVELSGLLDGELDPLRAQEVQAALARDPALRSEFEALRAADRGWRAAAGGAAIPIRTALPASGIRILPVAAPLLAVLVALRLLASLGDLVTLALLLHGVAFAALLTWTMRTAQARRPGSSTA
jgi:anti-sigma factor RsiW